MPPASRTMPGRHAKPAADGRQRSCRSNPKSRIRSPGLALKTLRGTIALRSQRAAETPWAPLAFDTNSPYLDGRAPLVVGQPEQRRYRARYVDGDAPMGDWSDIVEVTAKP